MPRGDGTGPRGMGSMTGRAAGYCAGFGMPGYLNALPGRGLGMGFGRGFRVWGSGFGGGGRGRRNMFYATGLPGWMRYGSIAPSEKKVDQETEKDALKAQADVLQSELEAIKKRLAEIEKNSAGTPAV